MAQTVPASELDEYLRLLELSGRAHGPLFHHSAGSPRTVTGVHLWQARHPLAGRARSSGLWLEPIDPTLVTAFNSGRPYGINDGALWAGKGASAAFSGGARVGLGPVTATFHPTVWTSENRAFTLGPLTFPDRSPFAYAWSDRIDWPQRLGDAAPREFAWGQSSVRVQAGPWTVGFGTENFWLGPAVRNPILMSSTAAGFPHLDLGLSRPAGTFLGAVEFRVLWGSLGESAYFDTIPGNDRRLFAGLTAAISPRWISGLTLGFARVFYQTWTDTLGVGDFLAIVQPFTKDAIATEEDPEGNDEADQMLALSARWRFPEVGFEVYGEWARNDHNRNWRDFLLEPDHSQAFLIGFQKVVPSGPGTIRLRGEWTHLGRSATFQVRATPTFYFHHIARQGYTHEGQLLGAGIGPGSDAQHVAIDRYDGGGRFGAFLERVRYNDDEYYRRFATDRRREGHNVELAAGLSAYRLLGPVDAGLGVAVRREFNQYYEIGADATNVTASATLRWRWR